MKQKLIIFLLSFVVVAVPVLWGVNLSAAREDVGLTAPAVYETKLALRDLWVEHIFWVRNYVGATHHNPGDSVEIVESEIVENARSIASSIEPFYGQAAADGLFELLTGHWTAIKSYNSAVLVENESGMDQSVKNLTANAREIARFLSTANPHLPEKTVFSLLSAHGGHHISQIKAFSKDDYASEADVWEAMRKHMFVISDAIAEALVKQFPEKFSS